MVYDLPVKEEKIKPHQVTTLHLISALAFMCAGAIIYRYNFEITHWGLVLLLAGLALTTVTIVRNKWLVRSRQVNFLFRCVELAVAAAVLVLAVANQWKFPIIIFGVLSAAIVFALYWERTADTTLHIHIDESGIRLPSTARKRFIPWTDVEQAVLRFGILSVDCVDNRLVQYDITGKSSDTSFDEWCAAQVEENRSKRRTDDW